MIYADWLAESGRVSEAEFIRLQCALAGLAIDDSRRAKLEERERELRESHEMEWVGELSKLVTAWEFHRGLIDSVSIEPRKFLQAGAKLFEYGPIRRVRFLDLNEGFSKLIRSKLLERVMELDLCGNEIGLTTAQPLANCPYLNQLETVDLGFTEIQDSSLQALFTSPVFSNLRSLGINDNSKLSIMGLKALAESPYLSQLRRLDISGNSFPGESIALLLDATTMQNLEQISVHGNRLRDAGMASLVRSAAFARMATREKTIDLRRNEIGPIGIRALAESPALETVEVLDLSNNNLGDGGVAALAESPYLKNLRILNLSENRISDDAIRHLIRSSMLNTLRTIDLTGNLITQERLERLHEASVEWDWRGLLEIKIDFQLQSRPWLETSRLGLLRRPN
jgi:Ran GTPase-activating protein (RanGAP) involved in mRNA processing and transport